MNSQILHKKIKVLWTKVLKKCYIIVLSDSVLTNGSNVRRDAFLNKFLEFK